MLVSPSLTHDPPCLLGHPLDGHMIRHVEVPLSTSLVGAREDDEMPPPLGIYSSLFSDEASIDGKQGKYWKGVGGMFT